MGGEPWHVTRKHPLEKHISGEQGPSYKTLLWGLRQPHTFTFLAPAQPESDPELPSRPLPSYRSLLLGLWLGIYAPLCQAALMDRFQVAAESVSHSSQLRLSLLL